MEIKTYWTTETPEEVETDKIILRWYPDAQKILFVLKEVFRPDSQDVGPSYRNINLNLFINSIDKKKDRTRAANIFRNIADLIERKELQSGPISFPYVQPDPQHRKRSIRCGE